MVANVNKPSNLNVKCLAVRLFSDNLWHQQVNSQTEKNKNKFETYDMEMAIEMFQCLRES